MGRYSIELVGESNYQPAVKRLRQGDPIELEHEPSNTFDPMAVVARDVVGRTVGYVPRDSWLQRLIAEEGEDVLARVRAIVGGGPGKPSLGVLLDVWTGKEAAAERAGVAVPDKPRPESRTSAALGQIIEHRAPARAEPPGEQELTWVEKLIDWAGFGVQPGPKLFIPGQRPPGWQAGPYAKPPPNSFQSCMGCVGSALLIVVVLFVVLLAIPRR
jgi:hypothetical protein